MSGIKKTSRRDAETAEKEKWSSKNSAISAPLREAFLFLSQLSLIIYFSPNCAKRLTTHPVKSSELPLCPVGSFI